MAGEAGQAPKCTNLEFYYNTLDIRVMKETFDTRANIYWEDGMLFYKEYNNICGKNLGKTDNDTLKGIASVNSFCNRWLETFHRFFSVATKHPRIGEFPTPIFYQTDQINFHQYFFSQMFFTSQFLSRNHIACYYLQENRQAWGYLAAVFVT